MGTLQQKWAGLVKREEGEAERGQHCEHPVVPGMSCTWASLAPPRSVTNAGDSKVSQLRAQVGLSPGS